MRPQEREFMHGGIRRGDRDREEPANPRILHEVTYLCKSGLALGD